MLTGLSQREINPNNAAATIVEGMTAEDSNAADEDGNHEEEDDAHFEKISKMYIKDSTRDSYNSANRALLLWLDKKQPNCVSEDTKQTLSSIFAAQQGATAKRKNTVVSKKAFEIIAKANPDSQPIVFENMTVKIFVCFLSSRAPAKDASFFSKSGSGGYRSAYKELHRQCEVEVDSVFEKDLGQKFKGLFRGYAQEKEEKGGRLAEGKDPMSFALYKFLCKKMVEDGSKESIFAHAFLTLTWNLICRSKNTIHIHRNHVTWGSDGMTIRFAHMKTDTEGGDSARLRHLFSNPYCLPICVTTAVGKYLSTFLPKENGMLFDGNSYNRFQKYLKGLVTKYHVDVERLGINPKDIGVLSIRKGAATYCCGGTTAAPHIAAVCNRAGWTMGKVKDTYIQYGEAGDQHVGRVVAGLPVLNAKYACSPAYICIDDTDNPEENTCTAEDVEHVVQTFFPGFVTVSISFKPVAIHCAAALLFAKDYFNEALSPRYVLYKITV